MTLAIKNYLVLFLFLNLFTIKLSIAGDCLQPRDLKAIEKNLQNIKLSEGVYNTIYKKLNELNSIITTNTTLTEQKCAEFNILKNSLYESIINSHDNMAEKKMIETFFKDCNFLLFQDIDKLEFIPVVQEALKLTLEALDAKKAELVIENDLITEYLEQRFEPSKNISKTAPKAELVNADIDPICCCFCMDDFIGWLCCGY